MLKTFRDDVNLSPRINYNIYQSFLPKSIYVKLQNRPQLPHFQETVLPKTLAPFARFIGWYETQKDVHLC